MVTAKKNREAIIKAFLDMQDLIKVYGKQNNDTKFYSWCTSGSRRDLYPKYISTPIKCLLEVIPMFPAALRTAFTRSDVYIVM